MNIDWQKLRSALPEAWENICDFPVFSFSSGKKTEHGSPLTPLLMPLLGWGAGMILFFVPALMRFLFNPAAGILIFLLSSWIFLSWKDSGRADRFLMHKILFTFRRGEEDPDHPLLLFLPPLLLRFLLLFFLGLFDGAACLPVLMLFSAATRAQLMPGNGSGELPAGIRKLFFATVAGAVFLSLFFTKSGTVFLLAAWLILELVRRQKKESFRTADDALGFCAVTEWVLLAAAILSL